ncbi:MAG: redox-sensing transcriptional repressor Rex [Bacteroidales bacterium]|nr:redox-sensing transcriptional repressor Rex [Bacteroidales bacterium]MCF8457667.1 redox-sensing transcriptional repressor Rex [Bacteroidales bacterium]
MIIKSNIQRVLRYQHCVSNFYELGFDKIYSHNLAEAVGVSPEQVRKDFSEFGIRGNKRGGYDIHQLLDTFQDIFHGKVDKRTILIGMGNIGSALVKYRGFKKKRISILAAFDIDPSKIKGTYGIPVYHFDEVDKFINENCIHTAILSVPVVSVQQVTDELVKSGIIGFLNFTPAILQVPAHVVVNNIDLYLELESLFYYIRTSEHRNINCKEDKF